MKINAPIAITSRTFSMHPTLRAEVMEYFSQVKFYEQNEKLEGDKLVAFLGDSPIAIIALNKINAEVLAKLPKLKGIAKYGVGLDNIDQEALKSFGVQLGWTGGVNRRAVAELSLNFMLSLLRRTPWHHADVKAGKWQPTTNLELSGKTVGLFGCGHIGKDLAKILRALDCKVLIHDLVQMPDFCASTGAIQVSKEQALAQADIISLHLPCDESTENFLSEREFSSCKPGAFLVNTCRGKVVDEIALFSALEKGQIRAAAFDVFAQEPPTNSPLLQHPNFLATPHIGGSTDIGVLNMGRAAIKNLLDLAKALSL